MNSHFRLWLLGVATLLCTGACEDECSLIQQTIVVPEPDPDLAALARACEVGKINSQAPCASVANVPSSDQISCACRPLCERVLGLIDGFPGPELLKSCQLHSTVQRPWRNDDAGLPIDDNAISVSLSYKPANCNEQAQ